MLWVITTYLLHSIGEPIDRRLIDVMIAHHESSIEAGTAAETWASHSEIKERAKAIVQAQEREIAQMKRWRQERYRAGA